jgi:hypothetical protein
MKKLLVKRVLENKMKFFSALALVKFERNTISSRMYFCLMKPNVFMFVFVYRITTSRISPTIFVLTLSYTIPRKGLHGHS